MTHLHHKVSALVDGELSSNARTRALAHARGCPQCRREIAETLEVKRRVTRLAPVEVSADLLDVVTAVTRPAASTCTSPRSALMRRVFVGVGSVSVVVVALAYVVGAPEQSQATPVSPPVEEFAAEFADSTGQAALSDPAVGGLGADLALADNTSVSLVHLGSASWPVPSGGPTASRPAPEVAPSPAADDPAASEWLRRAVEAPSQVGFEGGRVISSFTPRGAESSRLHVQHVPGQGTQFDVLGADGRVRTESFVGEPGVASDALADHSVDLLVAAYDLAVEGAGRIAGRRATTISASQDGEVKARFWIDDATGLLLRRTLYVDGQLVRWSGYTSIEIRHDAFMTHLSPELHTSPTVALSTSAAAVLNDLGWTCPARLAEHFRLSFLRQVEGIGGVVHAEYTDGVSTVAIFEERGSLDTSGLDGFRSTGPAGNPVYLKAGLPTIAVWESGGTVFTVVTDAPEQLAGGVTARLPHADGEQPAGVTTRIGNGLTRLASAIAP
ncbi:MAG: sigma-E factor regulatory protein RseB domain-containing protein [Nocardioidaceae bacterium]